MVAGLPHWRWVYGSPDSSEGSLMEKGNNCPQSFHFIPPFHSPLPHIYLYISPIIFMKWVSVIIQQMDLSAQKGGNDEMVERIKEKKLKKNCMKYNFPFPCQWLAVNMAGMTKTGPVKPVIYLFFVQVGNQTAVCVAVSCQPVCAYWVVNNGSDWSWIGSLRNQGGPRQSLRAKCGPLVSPPGVSGSLELVRVRQPGGEILWSSSLGWFYSLLDQSGGSEQSGFWRFDIGRCNWWMTVGAFII